MSVELNYLNTLYEATEEALTDTEDESTELRLLTELKLLGRIIEKYEKIEKQEEEWNRLEKHQQRKKWIR